MTHVKDQHDSGCKRFILLPADVDAGAYFSSCGKYRPKLWHTWGRFPARVLFLMMNPSGASHLSSDSTVAKCGMYARRWGYDGLYVGNVCDYRSTDPKGLLKEPNPVSEENLNNIEDMANVCDLIIVAHGKLPGALQKHADKTVQMLLDLDRDLHILKLSKNGIPMHPLARGKNHMSKDLQPILWKKGKR